MHGSTTSQVLKNTAYTWGYAWQASAANALQEQLAAADVLGSHVTSASVAWLQALACLVAAVRQEGAAVEALAQAWAQQKPALLSDSFRCAQQDPSCLAVDVDGAWSRGHAGHACP